MRENFEIEKELKFSNNIAEITSISLEERHEVQDDKLVGNFIVSGEYKIHEISLNKEKFNFKIPYEYDIKSDVEENSLDLEITNFVYDSDNDSLFVTIDYDLCGDRKDILLFDDKEDLDEFLKSREVELIIDDVNEEIDRTSLDTLAPQEEELDHEETKDDLSNACVEEVKEEEKQNEEEMKEFIESVKDVSNVDDVVSRNIEESKEQLLNSVKVNDDNYITYKVHIVKQEDTLESILVKYSITLDELKEYNDFNVLTLGDKLLIPIINEE